MLRGLQLYWFRPFDENGVSTFKSVVTLPSEPIKIWSANSNNNNGKDMFSIPQAKGEDNAKQVTFLCGENTKEFKEQVEAMICLKAYIIDCN